MDVTNLVWPVFLWSIVNNQERIRAYFYWHRVELLFEISIYHQETKKISLFLLMYQNLDGNLTLEMQVLLFRGE